MTALNGQEFTNERLDSTLRAGRRPLQAAGQRTLLGDIAVCPQCYRTKL